MASSTTSNVYVHVIEDVINKVRDEFINNGGPGESVLAELQGTWELKMMQAGAILGPIDRSAMQKAAAGVPITPNPVHDLNVPYTEEFETPTADLLFPPTPLQTPMVQTPLPGMAQTPLPGLAQTPLPGMAQTPLTGTDGSSLYEVATGGTPNTPNEFSSANNNGGVPDVKTGLGRPNPYMPPPSSWLGQRPPLDVNVAYVEGREEGERGASRQPATQDKGLLGLVLQNLRANIKRRVCMHKFLISTFLEQSYELLMFLSSICYVGDIGLEENDK